MTSTIPETHGNVRMCRGFLASPQLMKHQTRVDRMTSPTNEANHSLDSLWNESSPSDLAIQTIKPWSAPRSTQRSPTPWKPSTGMSSAELMSLSSSASCRSKRKKMLDLARRTELEERAQQKTVDSNTRAMKYFDRNRFRCIGTPLLNSDDRQLMSLRGSLQPNSEVIRNRTSTPVNELYHAKEPWGRAETILKRHRETKTAWENGQERAWSNQHRRTSMGNMSARRCDVKGYGSQVFVEFRKDHPTPEESPLVAGLDGKASLTAHEAGLHDHQRRPLTTYCKLQFSGQTFLVPETANQPPQRRIFLDTHYTPWEGRTVGIRAASRSEALQDRHARSAGRGRSASSMA